MDTVGRPTSPSFIQSLLTLAASPYYMPTHEAKCQGYKKIKTRSLLSRQTPKLGNYTHNSKSGDSSTEYVGGTLKGTS